MTASCASALLKGYAERVSRQGEVIPTVVLGPDETVEDSLTKENVVQQCVPPAAREARDPAIECQRKPSTFQLRCSFKPTCSEVVSRVEKAAKQSGARG